MKIENLKSWLVHELENHGYEITGSPFLSDMDVLILAAVVILKDIRNRSEGGDK